MEGTSVLTLWEIPRGIPAGIPEGMASFWGVAGGIPAKGEDSLQEYSDTSKSRKGSAEKSKSKSKWISVVIPKGISTVNREWIPVGIPSSSSVELAPESREEYWKESVGESRV